MIVRYREITPSSNEHNDMLWYIDFTDDDTGGMNTRSFRVQPEHAYYIDNDGYIIDDDEAEWTVGGIDTVICTDRRGWQYVTSRAGLSRYLRNHGQNIPVELNA
jgi:hypothetical protein